MADVPRHVCVILDEAYIEFNMLQDPDESVELLKRHPNLVLLRTFTKVYGLCGLRVGYGLCGSEDFRIAVDQVRQPFFCNAAAQAAALEALRHQDEVARRVERNLAERIGLEDGLRGLGMRARRVAGQLRLVRPAAAARRPARGARAGDRPRPRRARLVLVRAGTSLGRAGRAARDGRHRRPRTSASSRRSAALLLDGPGGRAATTRARSHDRAFPHTHRWSRLRLRLFRLAI